MAWALRSDRYRILQQQFSDRDVAGAGHEKTLRRELELASASVMTLPGPSAQAPLKIFAGGKEGALAPSMPGDARSFSGE
jgi:hypothetical protein